LKSNLEKERKYKDEDKKYFDNIVIKPYDDVNILKIIF